MEREGGREGGRETKREREKRWGTEGERFRDGKNENQSAKKSGGPIMRLRDTTTLSGSLL
jgi:hypothetical protein